MFWPKSLQSVNTLHTQFVKAVLGSVTIVTIQTMAYIDELDKTGENDQKWPKIWGNWNILTLSSKKLMNQQNGNFILPYHILFSIPTL